MLKNLSVPTPIPLRHALGAVALATGLAACDSAREVQAVDPVAAASTDGDWIRIDGTIVSTIPSQFVLDYGPESITVELDDWDLAAEGISLMPGDKVSVMGRVDKNLFNVNSIEAGAVYLHEFKTVYFASPADEEEFGIAAVPQRDLDTGIDYTGWVTGTTEDGFSLGAGPLKIAVDTTQLESPEAEDGVRPGDRVFVWGDLAIEAEGNSKLVADGLVELVNGGKSSERQPTSAADDSPGARATNAGY